MGVNISPRRLIWSWPKVCLKKLAIFLLAKQKALVFFSSAQLSLLKSDKNSWFWAKKDKSFLFHPREKSAHFSYFHFSATPNWALAEMRLLSSIIRLYQIYLKPTLSEQGWKYAPFLGPFDYIIDKKMDKCDFCIKDDQKSSIQFNPIQSNSIQLSAYKLSRTSQWLKWTMKWLVINNKGNYIWLTS